MSTLVGILCASLAAPAPSAPTAAEAIAFVDRAERELHELSRFTDRMDWVQSTYIIDDTDWLSAFANEQLMALRTRLIAEAARYRGLSLPADVARKLDLLRLSAPLVAPNDANARKELSEAMSTLQSLYGRGKACLKNGECVPINDVSTLMAKSRDPEVLADAWKAWHAISPPMRARYQRFVELGNKGAAEIGMRDLGELWRSGYDMKPEAFEKDVNRLWAQVRPFYEALHCYVRARLHAKYGEAVVPKAGPIPAHLLGNIWAQDWSNIYDLVQPFPGEASLDVGDAMKAKRWDAVKMMQTGERFFTSLGMPALPKTFWERSMITQPKDRDVVCHASAWDIGKSGDVRVKMCTQVNEDDLQTVHHELGHIYYYLNYAQRSPLFQEGANDGFHEGIGDTLVLAMTPAYLEKIGILDAAPRNPKADLNTLMKRALDKVAFLPFGLLIDQWRWQVFDGRIPSDQLNAGWWKLRREIQGVVPPMPRSEADFDPGAKYHVPANTPYTRYFLSHVLQFQFYRALCKVSGHKGPLHTCSFYGDKAAGKRLASMLELGASKPWPEALKTLSGETSVDASALAEYFAPLKGWLDEQNRGQSCGW